MAITRRKRPARGRRWLTLADAKLAVGLPLLWLFALTIPERRWRSLCYRLESMRASMRRPELARVAKAAANVVGASRPCQGTAFAIEAAAGCTEHHLQVLRTRSPGGWKAAPYLEGVEHLDAALAAGRGAVLWVAHFCFNALASKMALRRAGYRVWHLSRPEHGFSKSALGIALFNGIRVGAEREHLAGRIVFERNRPGAAMLAAQRVLKKNGIVSITAGDWEGQRLAEIDLCGGRLAMAVGAPGLARLTGAALLPVFTVRGVGQGIRVVIEHTLPVPGEGEADDALQRAAQAFGNLLGRYVSAYPAEWRDWKKLELPPETAADYERRACR
ncbi:MAG TPA: hypothetical protein VIH15_04595 [Casimicrobiaceae bacterium]